MSKRDLQEIVATLERMASERVAPRAASIDHEGRWPEESLRELLAEGLGGLVVPVAYGGLGHGLSGLARACEALGAACPSTAICFGMHCVGSAVLAARPTEEQRDRWLGPIVAGEHLTTLSLSEPGTGSHFYFPETTLTRTPEGLRLRGTKSFVTNGGHADSYVVSARSADPGAPPAHFSCVVVPAETPGLVWGPPWAGLGMRGNSSRNVELRDVAVPETALLGREGDELWYVFRVVSPYFLVAMAGTYLGAAKAALDEVRFHVGARRHAHTGATLAQLPILQHRFGTLWAQVERSRALLYRAAAEADSGAADALPGILSCKAEVADAAVEVVNGAMTLLGGAGYREGGTVGRLLRDVRAAHVMAPTTDTLRLWTGRALLGEPLLGE